MKYWSSVYNDDGWILYLRAFTKKAAMSVEVDFGRPGQLREISIEDYFRARMKHRNTFGGNPFKNAVILPPELRI